MLVSSTKTSFLKLGRPLGLLMESLFGMGIRVSGRCRLILGTGVTLLGASGLRAWGNLCLIFIYKENQIISVSYLANMHY